MQRRQLRNRAQAADTIPDIIATAITDIRARIPMRSTATAPAHNSLASLLSH
jgi:hypothetical protein